ncbi:hypothetical protein, partial [Streptomyces sp. NPDC055006]
PPPGAPPRSLEERLAYHSDDRNQHEAAVGFFRRLGGKPLGAMEYAEVLYGRAPRLLAYIVSRGGMRSRPSLLKLDAGTFTPVQIGDALVNLTGRAGMLARDVQDRQELEQTQKDLAEALKNAESSYRDEEQILHAVATRERARLETGRAHDLWRLASARAYVDTVVAERRIEAHLIVFAGLLEELSGREREVGQQLADARDTRLLERSAKDALQLKTQAQRLLEEANEKRGELHGALKGVQKEQRAAQVRAEGYDGPASAELAELLTTHQGDLVEAKADLLRADERVDTAGQELADAREGRTGQAAAVLQALHAGPCPDAVGLMASTRLHPDARSLWEARLAPWSNAVCVPPSLLDAAVEAVRDLPGTVLIAGPPAGAVPAGPVAGWPAGIADAAPLARSFLQTLADATTVEQPPHASLPSLGVHVVGGFERPIVGQADICAHLEEQLVRERAERKAVSTRIELYERRLTALSRDIDRAKAKEAASRLADQARDLEEALAAHDETLPGLRSSAETAAETAVRARDAFEGATKRVQGLLESVQKIKKEIGQTRQKRDRMLELRGRGPAHPGLNWDASMPEALAALNWGAVPPDEEGAEPTERISIQAVVPGDREQAVERRSSGELLSESRARLSSALARLSADSHSTGVATPELANALHHQEAHTEDPHGSIFRNSLSALVTWLADNEEQDRGAREQVEVKRAERANEHRYLQDIVEETREGLAQTQQSIKERVLGSLRRISDKLNELHSREGYKADLLCEVTEPQTAQDQWVCHVVPRWQRNPNGPLLPYDRPTNTAQEKLFSIHLVLAALLAAPDARGRVLILDELGDSLGAEHRREVIAALRDAAQDHGITVLATCQDVLMTDVRLICGQILQFRYYSKSDALNRPTLMFGLDDNGRRVRLTLDALVDSRA